MFAAHPAFCTPAPISIVTEDILTTTPPISPARPIIPTISTDAQVGSPVPTRQGQQDCATSGAVQRRPRTRRTPRQLPMPAATVRKEHFVSGGWIWQHCALDSECTLFPEYEAEYLRTRAEFAEQCNSRF